MLSVLGSVRIQPVNADETFSFLEYYNEVPEFERLRFDGKNVEKQPGVYSFNRQMPICATDQDILTLKRLDALFGKFSRIV